jgi:protocatechuate 3,4-dioxygenase beta subunit
LFKNKLTVNILIIAIFLSFTVQLSTLITPTSNLTGTVYAAGAPVSGAFVFASGPEGSGYANTTASGQYLIDRGIPTGSYTVSCLKEGYIITEIENVQVTSGAETQGINFNLTRSAGVSGKITDSVSGQPLQNIIIYAFDNNASTFGWTATTDSNGNYNMATNLATGSYNISALLPEGHVTKTRTVPLTAGTQTTGIDMALDRSGIISGTVTAFPSGTPIANATVSAISTASATQYYGYNQTDATGHYRIASGLGTATYTIYAQYGTGFNYTSDINVTAGTETPNIDLQLVITPPPASGIITGTVTDQNGKPITNAQVTAEGPAGIGTAETDNNGNYIISTGIPTGTYTVSATATGYQPQNTTNISVTNYQTTPNINFQLTPIPPAQSGRISGTVQGETNPIPELPYPITIIFTITLIAAALTKTLNNKTKRLKHH